MTEHESLFQDAREWAATLEFVALDPEEEAMISREDAAEIANVLRELSRLEPN